MMIRTGLLFFMGLICCLHGKAQQVLQPDDFMEDRGNWQTASAVALDGPESKLLQITPGEGLLTNGATGKTENLITSKAYRDLEVHAEFLIPENGNSGVYLMGRYEIQVKDSYGKEKLGFGDCGAIYQRYDESRNPSGWEGKPPRVNASKAPGAWQTLDIVFRAPRFDQNGNKIENARFIKVVLNGVVVQENQEVTGPTRASTFNDEQSEGPLMLQGDHGPVAYRNLRIRELELEVPATGDWRPLDLMHDFQVVLTDELSEHTAVQMDEGEIRVMYEWPHDQESPYGMVVSKAWYTNFDLEFEFRWGKRKFIPRLDKKKDAGFLYHIQQTVMIWPPALECQVQETDCGDIFAIRGLHAWQVTEAGDTVQIPHQEFGFANQWSDQEKNGWNTIRVHVRGNTAHHYVNGVHVNSLVNATYGGVPCYGGFIAFQIEHAEITYRNLRIRTF